MISKTMSSRSMFRSNLGNHQKQEVEECNEDRRLNQDQLANILDNAVDVCRKAEDGPSLSSPESNSYDKSTSTKPKSFKYTFEIDDDSWEEFCESLPLKERKEDRHRR